MPNKYNEKTSVQNQKIKIVLLTSNNPKTTLKKQGYSTTVINRQYRKHIQNIN
jgi:hypothetical protein